MTACSASWGGLSEQTERATTKARATTDEPMVTPQEPVVALSIDELMELLVLVVVAVRIHRLESPLAGALRLDEALLLARRHRPGRQSAAPSIVRAVR